MAAAGRTNNTEQLQRFINNLWQHKQKTEFCDFTLATNNISIECHKLVLSSASSYFSQLLCTSKHNTNIIDVTPLPEHILRTVVAFMYNSEYVIDDENVIELLKLSKTWHLDILTQLCVTYMDDNITINNACRFYNYASVNVGDNNPQLLNAFIQEHFTSLHKSDQLSELSLKNFTTIIEHDEINVKNEDVIFSSAVQIIDQQTSAEEINRCLELIRFPQMSGDFLLDVVQSHPLMKDPPRDRYVQEAVRYQINGKSSKLVKPRRQWQIEMYYIDKNQCLNQYVSTSGTDESSNMVTLPKWVDNYSSVTFNKICIVVTGGWNNGKGDKRVLLLDMSNQGSKMIQLTDLPQPLRDATVMMTENNDVYVIGGRSTDRAVISSVYCLSFGSYEWQMKQPMLHAVGRPLVIQRCQYIYALGGHNNDSQPPYLSSVSQYNIKDDTWKSCKDLPVASDSTVAGVVVHEDRIKVITVDKCLMYDDDTDTWTVKSYKKLGDAINAFTKKGQIWAAVKMLHAATFRIMSYDDELNEWTTEVEKVPNAYRVFMFC